MPNLSSVRTFLPASVAASHTYEKFPKRRRRETLMDFGNAIEDSEGEDGKLTLSASLAVGKKSMS